MPLIDKRLLDLTDPTASENFNRVLKVADGATVASITLTVDATGKVTGGTAVMKDGTTVPVTVAAAT